MSKGTTNSVLDYFIDQAAGKYGPGPTREAMKTVMDAAIHGAGKRAYEDGHVRDTNPYAGTPHAGLWDDGWLDAAMEAMATTDA